MKFLPKRSARTCALAGTLLAGVAFLSACAGDNAFVVGPGTGTGPGGPGSGAQRDTVRPTLNFVRPVAGSVAAVGDSLRVEVAIADAGGLARVEVSAMSAAGVQRYERATRQYPAGDTVRNDTVRVLLMPTGERVATDPLLVIARVTDRAGNVREDTVRVSLALIRGTVQLVPGMGNRFADLVSDGRRVFLSNIARNRVDVFDIGTRGFSSFPVGSEPWGLALGVTQDTLFVANSGGTNISVIPLAATPLRELERRRVFTQNLQLYGISYDQAGAPSGRTIADYSDRPQFVGQIRSGQLLYSTKPTGTARDGTVRIYDVSKDSTLEFGRGSEIFTGYGASTAAEGIVVNALSAMVFEAEPKVLQVCPRRVRVGSPDPPCVRGTNVFVVSNALAEMRRREETDTRFDIGVSLASVGLSDTTFIAVSRDRSTIAFGEGARNPGRVLRFAERGGVLTGSSVETSDLIGNAAERVIGLALNGDGTLGAARGTGAYFFNNTLRLQGVGRTGEPSGGIAFHLRHR
jgi:DNA-binding beta-propeller fold protein YncE